MEKIPCKKCGTLIVPLTSKLHDGYCVPCARSEKPHIKALNAFNRTFEPFFKWLNNGKTGGGCMMMSLIMIGVSSISYAAIKAKNSSQSHTQGNDQFLIT